MCHAVLSEAFLSFRSKYGSYRQTLCVDIILRKRNFQWEFLEVHKRQRCHKELVKNSNKWLSNIIKEYILRKHINYSNFCLKFNWKNLSISFCLVILVYLVICFIKSIFSVTIIFTVDLNYFETVENFSANSTGSEQ